MGLGFGFGFGFGSVRAHHESGVNHDQQHGKEAEVFVVDQTQKQTTQLARLGVEAAQLL